MTQFAERFDPVDDNARRGLEEHFAVVGSSKRSCGPNCWKHRASRQGIALSLRNEPGHDHSYYFISTFLVDHVAWHAESLRRG